MSRIRFFINLAQAGLLMHTKEFATLVWEENVKTLGMPHFYLGKHSSKLHLSKLVLYFYLLFPAFVFLGIGSVISIIVFNCEKVFDKKKLS